MTMPMVQVRPVFVSVLLRFVFMQVHMAYFATKSFMIVVMMEQIMLMRVLVQYFRFMPVKMDMILAEDEYERCHNKNSRQRLCTSECLTKGGHRQQKAK